MSLLFFPHRLHTLTTSALIAVVRDPETDERTLTRLRSELDALLAHLRVVVEQVEAATPGNLRQRDDSLIDVIARAAAGGHLPVRRLEEAGVIRGYRADLDPSALEAGHVVRPDGLAGPALVSFQDRAVLPGYGGRPPPRRPSWPARPGQRRRTEEAAMDWDGVIEKNREALKRVVASLFAMAGLSIVISFAFIYGDQVVGWSQQTAQAMFVLTQLTATVLTAVTHLLEQVRPHAVMVQGDTTTTFVGALGTGRSTVVRTTTPAPTSCVPGRRVARAS